MQVRYCKSAYGGSLIEVDRKSLVSLNRSLGVYGHVFPEDETEPTVMRLVYNHSDFCDL